MNTIQNFKISQVKENTLIVGVDIGSSVHYARVFDWRGIEQGKVFKFSNSFDGFNNFLTWVHTISKNNNKDNTIIGVEPTGHYWFSLREFLHENSIQLVLVNPYHVKQTKEFDDNNQTKNDAKDPSVIAKLVIRGSYNISYIPEGIYANLRIADKMKENISKDLIAIKNKIKRWLSIYFPEFTSVYSDICGKSAIETLKKYPLPKDIVSVGIDGIISLWKEKKIKAVGTKKATEVFKAAQNSIGIKTGNNFSKLEINMLIQDLEYKERQLEEIIQQMENLCNEIPEIKEIAKIKDVGFLTAVSFVAEIGDIRRFNSPKQIQKYAGLALKENSSGKHKGITRISKRGRRRLRTLLFRVAIPLVTRNIEFQKIYAKYLTREQNPLKKKQALIAISCKLIRIFYAILSKGLKYDEQKLLNDMNKNILMVG